MGDFLDDNELDPQPDPRLARAQPDTTPMLRGLSPAPLGAPMGSTTDLENKVAAPIQSHPIQAPPTPTPLQTRTAKDQGELARLNDTGSGITKISRAHPVAGGLLRGLNVVGDVASAFLPELHPVMGAIPGTEEHHRALVGNQGKIVAQDQAEQAAADASAKSAADTTEAGARTEEQESAAENQRAEAAKARADTAHVGQGTDEWVDVPTLVGPNNEPVEYNKSTGTYRYGDLAGAKPLKTPTETSAADKQANEAIAKKAALAGFPLNDPRKFQANLDAAVKAKAITKEEAAQISSFETFNSTPATNLTVHVEGGQAATDTKQKAGYYAVNGRLVRGDRLSDEERANALPVKDPEKAEQSIRTTNSTLNAFGSYRKTLANAKLTPDDVRALEVLTNPEPIARSLIEKEEANVFDALAGEPLSGYSTKAFGGIMTKDQYDKLSPDGQKALIGYFNSVIANFADMKARLGSIGRNESQVAAELHTIPLPYIPQTAADGALETKIQDVAGRNIYYGELGPNSRQDTGGQGGGGIEYKPGLIRNGYKFKGGDPTDQNNWEKVQPKKP